MIDYSVFDTFCKVPTWHTSHPMDQKRFHSALKQVVRESSFSPEMMGDYIRQNHAEPMWPKESEELQLVISDLVSKAWAVKDYLEAD